jgi:hypothetical protein
MCPGNGGDGDESVEVDKVGAEIYSVLREVGGEESSLEKK